MSDVDWGRYNLPAIWSLIADVDVCDGADRVLAWDGLATAMRDQHKRLLTSAAKLAEVWPPESNESAAFFQQQVGGLAESMQETMRKAEDTKAGLQGVIQAFGTAQDTVRALASGRQGVSNDWMPRFVDHAEDVYDEHAQAAMRQAEAAIQDHGSQIQPPGLFQMHVDYGETGYHLQPGEPKKSTLGRTGQSGLRADPRPVAVPTDSNSMIPPGPSAGPGGVVAPGADEARSNDDGGGAGPVLSGVATGVPAGVGAGGPIGALPSAPSTGSGGGPGGFGILPIGGGGPSAGTGVFGSIPDGGGSGVRRPVPVRRGLPSGAVIGEESYSGAVNGRGNGATGTMPWASGSGGRGQERSEETLDGEPDERWQTYEGVAPVIEPATEPVRHDPGPGVIGFDR